MSVARTRPFIYPSLLSSLVPAVSRSTFCPATPTATNQPDRSDSVFLPSLKKKKRGGGGCGEEIFACAARSHGHNSNISPWDHEGFTACIIHGELDVTARTQICVCTARKDGVKNANSDTQMRAVNPGLIVYSAHWLQCAAASPLYSIELPSILTVAPSRHVLGGAGGVGGGGLPKELCAHSDTQGLFACTSTDKRKDPKSH